MTDWHPMQKFLHWTMAALLLAMVAAGLLMARAADRAALTGDFSASVLGLSLFEAYQLHKSFGVLLFALVLLRLATRALRSAPALPGGMAPREKLAARGAHVALYALMLSLPVTGWLMASASPLGVPTIVFGLFTLPHPIGPDAEVEALLSWLHFAGGMALLALTALHVAAALKHHLVDRDDVLRAMLPRRLGTRLALVLGVVCASGLAGVPALAQTAWTVDPEESALTFAVRVAGSEAAGGFDRWTAEIDFDPSAPEDGSVTVRIDMSSVFIDMAQARGAIGGAEWLDVSGSPEAVFTGSGFVMAEDGRFTLPGTLTLRGVSRPLTVEGTLRIEGGTANVDLEAPILRLDYGVGTPDPSVSPEVRIAAAFIASREP